MQSTSALYKSILAGNNHWYETKVNIGGVDYGENVLFSVSTSSSMFSGNPELGKAISGEIDISMIAPSTVIPKMATIIPYVRVCNATQQSEWIQHGVYFIDTRETTQNGDGLNVMDIHGYDAMLKGEQMYPTTSLDWPAVDTDVLEEIASFMGVDIDSRTYDIMTEAYTLPLPASYTMREVLGYLGSMYAGSFIITELGKLRLISIYDLPPETNYLVDNAGSAITFGGDRILV